MAVRSSGGGQLDRIMRRMGSVMRFKKLGQAAPGRTLQQQGTQGAPLPRPPAQGPAAPAQAAAPQVEQGGALTEGQPIVVPAPGETAPGVPAVAPPARGGELLGDIQESPAVGYWRRYGMMPSFLSLQVMTTRRQLELKLGRPPTSREIAQSLSQRDASAGASVTPTI